MARINPTTTTLKVLWGRAAGRCNICRELLPRETEDGNLYTTVGKTAHICAAEPGGPRFDATLTDEETRSYPNLILLCATHHDEVDADIVHYTRGVLREIKSNHEEWVRIKLMEMMPTIGYPDLEVIITYLGTIEVADKSENYSITEIKSKIKKNEISSPVERLIQMGLTQAPTINSYLNEFPDPQYADRLKQSFVVKYLEFREAGLSGDDLFYELIEYVKCSSYDLNRTAAAIALITYFFERCDIFEK